MLTNIANLCCPPDCGSSRQESALSNTVDRQAMVELTGRCWGPSPIQGMCALHRNRECGAATHPYWSCCTCNPAGESIKWGMQLWGWLTTINFLWHLLCTRICSNREKSHYWIRMTELKKLLPLCPVEKENNDCIW